MKILDWKNYRYYRSCQRNITGLSNNENMKNVLHIQGEIQKIKPFVIQTIKDEILNKNRSYFDKEGKMPRWIHEVKPGEYELSKEWI